MLTASWARRRRKRREPDWGAVEAELETAVREEIDERLGRDLKVDIATLTVHRYGPEVACDFEIVPATPAAAGLSIGVSGDEVTLAVGNGSVDFIWDQDGEWRRSFGEVLEAVAEGRFEERIAKGWIFERKVEMLFPGAQLARAHYARLAYQGEDSTDTAPDTGVRRYPAWDAGHAG